MNTKKQKENKRTTGCRTLKSYCKKRSIDGKLFMIKGQSQNKKFQQSSVQNCRGIQTTIM